MERGKMFKKLKGRYIYKTKFSIMSNSIWPYQYTEKWKTNLL